jgi:hypothetical protein
VSAHKLHSPSSAARRRLCPGSLAACQGEPNENSVFAAEGTAYHHVAASVLERIAECGGEALQGTECADWIGLHVHVTPETSYAGLPEKRPGDEFVFKITEEDAAYAQVYVDAMVARKRGNTMQFYEVAVDTSRVIGIPGQGGTSDCVTLDFDTLTIYSDDLKFGKGKRVTAFWKDAAEKLQPNDQGAEYGAGVLDMYRMLAPWKRVVVGIHQPRAQDSERYTELEMTVEELDAWARDVCRPYEQKAHALLTASPEEIMANLKPSKEGCKFCPLDSRCKAQIDEALAAYPVVNGPDGANEGRRRIWVATDEEFAKVLNLAERYSDFWGAVWGEGMRRAEARGGSFGDWMIAMGKKGHRALDPDAMLPPLVAEDGSELAPSVKVADLLVTELGDDAYAPQEFKTASKLDELLNKKGRSKADKEAAAGRQALWRRLAQAVTQPDGKPTLVRKDLGRAPMPRVSGADEFATIEVPVSNLL